MSRNSVSPELAGGQPSQTAVSMSRAQHYKLPPQLDRAVHCVLNQVDAFLQAGQGAKGVPGIRLAARRRGQVHSFIS